jgi:alpha-amylase/alpha-mannosidase (GH57 family)
MSNRIKLVLCWHMHQPYYREGLDGDFRLPWVYLHTIKDYSDMAMHLERHPQMRVVVNFAPVLLEQIDDYRNQLSDYLKHGRPMGDPLLNFLAGVHPIPDDTEIRRELVRACRRANGEHMINPYPVFVDLLEMVTSSYPTGEPEVDLDRLPYLDAQYFLDLLTWFHLAWLGHSLKQTDTARYLMSKGRYFTHQDRQSLIELIYNCHDEILPRYRKLAERGQMELSMTPYSHPIVPLLNSFDNMDCAQPEAPKPENARYPGGHDRSDWHMQHGIDVFSEHFGHAPKGIWFSEGGISDDAIDLLDKYQLHWTASGEGVWHNSCTLSGCDPEEMHSKRALFTPFRIDDTDCCLYFRDDGLSDLIGFEYNKWDAADAVADFTSHLVNIADFFGDQASEHIVAVILDGENAWEYYPDNAWHFIDRLYASLTDHPRIETTDFDTARDTARVQPMKKLCPGSWVYGTFSTWIGEPEKNRAWDLLIEAKQVYDEVLMANELDETSRLKASRQLAICEGSDWFWWFGDYNPSESVRDFDYLFRHQLDQLYRILGRPIPENLSIPVSTGGDYAESAGTMRRSHT